MDIVQGIEKLCDSKLWDNQISWNTTSPELSSCFNESVIVWIPAAFLWLTLPYLIFDFVRSTKNSIDWNYYNILRFTVAVVCTCVTLVDCILCLVREYQWNDSPTTLHLLSTVIHFITRLLLCIIFYCQRVCGIHISGNVWFYLLFDSVLGAFSVVTYTRNDIRQSHEYILYLIQYSLVVLLLLICSFSDNLPPSNYSDDLKGKICPKEKASFPSKLTFWWLNALAIKGWRSPLTSADLWDVRREDRCKNVFRYFNKYWQNSRYNEDEPVVGDLGNGEVSYKYKSITNLDASGEKKKETKILLVIGKAFWVYFLIPSILKLASDVVQLSNPMILKLLIGFTTNDKEPLWHGYIFALLFVLTNIFQSLISAYHAQRMSVLGMRIRSCLVSAVYRKSLVLSNYAKKGTTTGEIVNLMAVDSQRFIDLLPWLSFLWTAPVQVVIALWLLYNELGVSVIGGLVVMIAIIPINGFVAGKVKQIQTNQMKLKDQRLKAMNEILSGMKVLKLYAWEEAFIENILGIRAKELSYLRKSGYLGSIFVIISSCTPFLVSLTTFAIYILIDEKNVLDAQKAFVSIALFNLLRIPLTMIPNMITSLILTMVSVKRLNKFLNFQELSAYVTRNLEKEPVKIENGAFTWDRLEDVENGLQPTLEKINLNVGKGKFVAVVGNVGSGKSSLLSALLGEMEQVKGSVNISGDANLAYVPQQAWIQNATLRDNILFGQDMDHKKYRRVIRACALKQDLSVLAGGDQTEIGEKGINLSGGQKQRVSLARACYSDANLFLFDDPLSAVDSHVGKHIFDEVLSSKSGLLRDKTRILVTNSLFVLPNVDLIVVLKNGKVIDIGTYDELMTQKGEFAELINQYSSNKPEDKEEEFEQLSESRRRASTIEVPLQKSENSKLVEVEKAETGEVKLTVYKKFAKSMSLFWTIGIITCYAASTAANSGSSFWLSAWTNDADTSPGRSGYRLGIYALIGSSQAIFVGCGWISIVSGSLLASSSLHQKLLEKIMHAPMYFFDTTPLGRVLNRFSKDIDILDTIIQLTTRVLINTSFQVLATIVIISIQTPIFTAVVVPVMILYYFIQKFYVVTSRQLKRLESITRSPIYTHFSETINGVSTIRAYGVNQRFIHESDERVDNNQVCFYPNAIANCWLQVRLEFLANCLIFFAALFAVLAKGTLNAGETGLSISYALNITLSLNWMVRMFAEMENNVVAVERIDEYSNIDSEANWYSDNKPAEDWPQNGTVQFVEYATKYRPGLDLVLKGIDLNVEKGEKIGIVGRTGAGKSSLTLALFRIIEATYGRIVIDGIDISKLGLQELRSRLTIIPQDPVLFSGTIRTNLDPFQKCSDDELWTALEHSHLKSFVKSLDAGFEYKVSEGGENLSVGQRQLICLARALLRNTNILILDEATAAVDLETDALIQTTIRSEFSRCTVLTIAHRLHTIMDSDRVLVLHDGKVAEFSSPQNLLENDKSLFYSLAKDAGLI